ncbi:site-2 protease family protein [bacterium]|nr:site-2 protease family protein [bacterium]
MFTGIEFIFGIAILIMSVVVHEVSHGLMANRLGDPTARMAGRLTLNPFPHLDPVGSVIVPAMTYFLAGGMILGWAKPVPYNPDNLRDKKWGDAKVAAAGPISNILLALFFGMIIRFGGSLGITSPEFMQALTLVVFINVLLAVFNLIPIPPLDGSKVLFNALPYQYHYIQDALERYWLVFIAVFIFFLWSFISPVVTFIFRLITGL